MHLKVMSTNGYGLETQASGALSSARILSSGAVGVGAPYNAEPSIGEVLGVQLARVCRVVDDEDQRLTPAKPCGRRFSAGRRVADRETPHQYESAPQRVISVIQPL
jgi:hypothetical protein